MIVSKMTKALREGKAGLDRLESERRRGYDRGARPAASSAAVGRVDAGDLDRRRSLRARYRPPVLTADQAVERLNTRGDPVRCSIVGSTASTVAITPILPRRYRSADRRGLEVSSDCLAAEST